MMTRRCYRCRMDRSLDQFPKSKATGKHRPLCTPCIKFQAKRYKLTHPQPDFTSWRTLKQRVVQ